MRSGEQRYWLERYGELGMAKLVMMAHLRFFCDFMVLRGGGGVSTSSAGAEREGWFLARKTGGGRVHEMDIYIYNKIVYLFFCTISVINRASSSVFCTGMTWPVFGRI